MKNKVVLIYPSSFSDYSGSDIEIERYPSIPNGLLALSSFIAEKGYPIKLIDCRLYNKRDINGLIKDEIKDVLCVGFSCMTGQVKHGLLLSRIIKRINPSTPIVWGGMHPTLFPKQTCSNDYIDFVVQGEGEFSFFNLLSYLSGQKIELDSIDGLVYKLKRGIEINNPSAPLDVNLLPDPNYDLLEDIEKYINRELFHYKNKKKVRGLDLHTSRGCPYRCSFCTNTLPCFKRWRPFSVERTMNIIKKITKKYQLNHIWFSDDFFFGNKKRVIQLVEGMSQWGEGLTWEANVRANNIEEEEYMEVLKKNGCWGLRVGFESGSQRVLDILKKDITIADSVNIVKLCKKFGIFVFGFFMIGIPGEKKEDINSTISLILKLNDVNRDAVLGSPGIFRPYPGTELYDECKKLGFLEPSSLEDWADCDFNDPSSNLFVKARDLPWIDDPKLLEDLGCYVYWFLDYQSNINNPKFNLFRRFTGIISEIRLKRRIWFFRWEVGLYRFVKMIVQGRNKNA